MLYQCNYYYQQHSPLLTDIGSVNQSMREMQLNSRQYFAPVPARATDAAATKGKESSNKSIPTGNPSKSYGQGQSIAESKPCPAAQLCLREAKPLFSYWLQLPQHSDMVGTILDRLSSQIMSNDPM